METPKKNNPQIIHVSPYYPPRIGGVELRVRDLATRLAARGVDVSVFTAKVGTMGGQHNMDGVKVFYLSGKEFMRTPITPSLARQLMRIKKPAVIHLHISHVFFPEVTAFIAKLRGIPYVAHVRAILTSFDRSTRFVPVNAYRRFILKPVLRNAAKVIVLTSDYKEIIHRDFKVPLEMIFIIPNATTFSVLHEARTQVHKPLRLLAVGRVSSQKNYPFMLDVVECLKKTHSLDFRLKIVGGGPGSAALEAEAHKRGLSANIEFLGEKTGKALEELYEQADLLLHTSFMETFGTVFIEAMTKGLPIIAPNILGARNVVKDGENGLLADFSAEEMSKTVLRLTDDPVLYRKISQNNLDAAKRYGWKEIVDQTVELYLDC